MQRIHRFEATATLKVDVSTRAYELVNPINIQNGFTSK